MVNVITRSKTKNRWRSNPNSKYRGASDQEVIQRCEEVASQEGATERDVHNAAREMTMFQEKAGKTFEQMQAGIIAGTKKLNEKSKPTTVKEKK